MMPTAARSAAVTARWRMRYGSPEKHSASYSASCPAPAHVRAHQRAHGGLVVKLRQAAQKALEFRHALRQCAGGSQPVQPGQHIRKALGKAEALAHNGVVRIAHAQKTPPARLHGAGTSRSASRPVPAPVMPYCPSALPATSGPIFSGASESRMFCTASRTTFACSRAMPATACMAAAYVSSSMPQPLRHWP